MIPWVYQELLGKTLLYDILGEEAKKDMKKPWPQRKRKQIYIDLPRIRLSGPDLFPESERTWWHDICVSLKGWILMAITILNYILWKKDTQPWWKQCTSQDTQKSRWQRETVDPRPDCMLRVMPGSSLHQEGTHAIPREKCARISSLWDWFVTCLHNS